MFGFGRKKTVVEEAPARDYVKREVPFDEPSAQCKRPEEKELSKEERLKYYEVLKYFLEVKEINDYEFVKNAPDGKMTNSPVTELERSWLTRECLLRYLRATKWVVKDAISRIESTLSWRREFGISKFEMQNLVNSESVKFENETGKEVIFGYDLHCRPCLYLKPGRQNTATSHTQVELMFFLLERTIDYMPPGQDSLALLIDFKSSKVANKNASKIPPLAIGKEVLHILQNHYPERLGRAYLTNIPLLAWTFLKLIHPFIDPMTREKLIFDEPFTKYMPLEQLDKDYGGDIDFKYNHDLYWNEMNKIAISKKNHYMERFNKFGKCIGLSEFDLRGDSDELAYPLLLLEKVERFLSGEEDDEKEVKKDLETAKMINQEDDATKKAAEVDKDGADDDDDDEEFSDAHE